MRVWSMGQQPNLYLRDDVIQAKALRVCLGAVKTSPQCVQHSTQTVASKLLETWR